MAGTLQGRDGVRLYFALARANEASPDGRLVELVQTLPPREAGFPVHPRLVILARLHERLGRPADALAAARAAREAGLVDVGTYLVDWRSLAVLGQAGEADRLAGWIERIAPSAFPAPVVVKVPR